MRRKLILSLSSLLFILFFASGGWLPQDIRLDVGDLPGAMESYYPKVACSGSNVYVAWEDRRDGWRDIYFNYSRDGGRSWRSSDIRLDTGDQAGAYESYDIDIACAGDNVYVAWQDARNGARDIYLNYSNDGGETWQTPDIRLDTGDPPGADYSWYPKIACSGENVYVVWHDYRPLAGADIYFNYSQDGGATWQTPDVRIDTGDDSDIYGSYSPDIVCNGSKVYIVWEDDRNAEFQEDIYFKCSTDGGETWPIQDVRLDTGTLPGASRSYFVKITCSGNNLYVVWSDERRGEYIFDIYSNYSIDGGETWQATDIRVNHHDPQSDVRCEYPQIACSGHNVYVLWTDYNDFGSTDVYFNHSADAGANWQASDIRLDSGDLPGASESWGAQMSCWGGNVYAVWADRRGGGNIADIFFNFSTDYGANWKTKDIRLNTRKFPSDYAAANPAIACSKNNVYVAWFDYRNGYSDIYFNANISFLNVLRLDTTEGGTTRPKPGKYDCVSGKKVRVEAIPDEGYHFSHWSGDAEGTENPLKVRMNSDMSIKAHFAQQCTLKVKAGKGGATDPAPGIYTYDPGEEVTIKAIPDDGYRFGSWSGDVEGIENPIKVRMDGNKSIKANFIRQCSLTLACGEGGTTEPAPGSRLYDAGTKITLKAIPDSYCEFSHWGGDAAGRANPKIITLGKDKSIMAHFIRLILSPINFTGEKRMNRSLLQVEYINALEWQAHPNNANIVKYRIYLVGEEMESLLAELDADTFEYWHRGVGRDAEFTYALVAVNDEGREGGKAYITVPPF
jgi:hypothetical protein